MCPRVDYDQIAAQYDAQPFRDKPVDLDLLAFLSQRAGRSGDDCALLDIGCGTGNQLVSNRAVMPAAQMVGVDRFHGMLRQAAHKMCSVGWVQADGANLPLVGRGFDFVTSQFSFHHLADKSRMLAEVFRVLKAGGRFVMTNICPREMRGWVVYRFFPAALARDLRDFMPYEDIKLQMEGIGFERVTVTLDHETGMRAWHDVVQAVRWRERCSQLLTLTDEEYHAGLRRVLASPRAAKQCDGLLDEFCLLKVIGDRTSA